MAIINITSTQVSGAIFPTESDVQISVGKGQKAQVTSTGYIGAGEVKGDDGTYTPSAFGRLRVLAAKVKTEKGVRLVLAVDGGLHGVLFPAKKGKDYDYVGNVEAGDGQHEYVLFGRTRAGKDGTKFLSLNSMDRQVIETGDSAPTAKPAAKNSSSNGSRPAPQPAPESEVYDDDIPF